MTMYVFDSGSYFYVVSRGMPTDPVEFGMGDTLRAAVESLSPTPEQSAGRWSVERAAGFVTAYGEIDADDDAVVGWYTDEHDYDVDDILEELEAHKLYGDAMNPDMADYLMSDVVEAVEAAFPGADHRLRVAVAHGLAHVEEVLERVRTAKRNGSPMPYDFIEVMACPGGCVGGGGQSWNVSNRVRLQRASGLLKEDRVQEIRTSYANPWIKALYDEFLGAPLSTKARELLHTRYQARPEYLR